MAGAHACPVCDARFTRPQHVTRHMRSHTGDRPYKCTQCGDQFARSDLLSRHVNKCHNGQSAQTLGRGRKAANANNTNTAIANLQQTPHEGPCDECIMNGQLCDLGTPCGKCLIRKASCVYSGRNARPRRASAENSLPGNRPNLLSSQDQIFQHAHGAAGNPGQNLYGDAYLPARNFPLQPATYTTLPDPSFYSSPDYELGRYGSQHVASSQLPTLSASGYHHAPQYGVPPTTNDGVIPPTGSATNGFHYRRSSLPSSHSSSLYGGGAANNFYPPATSHVQPTAQQIVDAQARGIPLPQNAASFPHLPSSTASSYSGSAFQSPIRSQGHFDDASSSSDFGTASTPSPSFSYRDTSSRPGSSAGISTSNGLDSPTRISAPASDSFISSLSGAVPLPTPMQLQSFGSFPVSGTGLTPGGFTDGKFRKPGPDGTYPPYQSLEHMSLEDAAAFAAAASNASGAYGLDTPGGTLPTLLLSAGGREAAIQDLKDFWSAFIAEPLTGGTTGGSHALSKQTSMPSLKTPMPNDKLNGNSILEQPTPRAVYPSKPSEDSTKSKAVSQQAAVSIAPTTEEDLKYYQEACLKRETPMLRLNPHRPKSMGLKAHSVSPHTNNNATLHPIQNNPASNGTGPKPSLPGVSSITSDHAAKPTEPHFAVPYPPNKDVLRQWNALPDRPSYKRLASQTLGPENTKVPKQNSTKFPGEDSSQDGDGSAKFLSPSNSQTTLVSVPLPGYQQKITAGSGGVHGAWNRQRSVSSPSSTRPFDWHPLESKLR